MVRLVLIMCLLVPPRVALAEDFVAVPGRLSDAAFYRLVACAAPPGGDCTKPMIRWPAPARLSLRVGLAEVTPDLPDYKFDLFDLALDAAIAEINGVGAHLFLERVYEGQMDIPLYVVATPQGGRISGTGVADLDGAQLSIGRIALRSRGEEITAAAVAISAEIRRREIASVVLEELVQALGLVTDIASPAYAASIFAETSNSTTRLRGQDAEALRRHYPRP